MTNVIELRGLRKHYGTFHAVDGLDLTVEQGDVYGFLGPNGAGKSTTIRMMMSLIAPTDGSITMFGESLATHRESILRRIGAIVERPDFYNYLTAFKNLELVGRLSGADVSRANIMRVLDVVSLADRAQSKVKTYSHGMKQRLGIAQALLHDPELIILDEPTTGLDPQGMKDIRDLILSLRADHHKTILLSSHILPEVELTATRMVIINKGKAVVEGSVNDLLNAGTMKVTIETGAAHAFTTALGESAWASRVTGTTEHAVIMQLDRDEIPHVVRYAIDRSVTVNAVVPVRSLEEYFLSLTTQGAS